MRLKVDLQCHRCYNKVKKLLCKFPQIRDQMYDEKHNIVTITVVCCNPEGLRDKLCCKGCGAIKSIEIVEPPKPKPETPKKKTPPPPPPAANPQPPPAPAPNPQPPPAPAPNPQPPPPVAVCPPPAAPPPTVVPIRVCCTECYEGRPGGPCFEGYGGPPSCYEAYYGRPVCDSYGWGRPCYVSRCDEYFCEENTSACTIM